MPISRKHFVAAATLGLSGTALARPKLLAAESSHASSLHFHVLRPSEYDRARMLRVLRASASSKQVFQSGTPLLVAGDASIYIHMQNAMNAYEFSYAKGPGSLATLGVLAGPSIVYALQDAIWTKYALGRTFSLASTNIYYAAKSLKENGSPDDPDSIYQDWSAQAVLHRGGCFFVCHNAMTAVAGLIGMQSGTSGAAVLADFEGHLLPGFQIVPAAVAAVQLAQDLGWRLYPII